MDFVLLVLAGSLGVLFLWGMLAPRSQWRLLVSWTYRDPHANEPTGFAFGLYRVVAALGIATMVVSMLGGIRIERQRAPDPSAPPTAVERMWRSKTPVVVNRVVTSEQQVPQGLVDQPILGYQALDGARRQPPYLFSLPTFNLKSATTRNGLIGVDPPTGLTALDSAQLVVEVSGDPLCFPHDAVVLEGESSVQIAIYYGQSNPAAGSTAKNLANCNTQPGADAVATLIPIRLGDVLGDREVQTLGGAPVSRVPVLQ